MLEEENTTKDHVFDLSMSNRTSVLTGALKYGWLLCWSSDDNDGENKEKKGRTYQMTNTYVAGNNSCLLVPLVLERGTIVITRCHVDS